MTDWSKCPAVEQIPGKVSGAWLFTDSRLPVSAPVREPRGPVPPSRSSWSGSRPWTNGR